jgi:hypothetical protein
VVDDVNRWTWRTELPAKRLLGWLDLHEGKFYDGKNRYGKANEHNGQIPRDGWLEAGEKRAILDYHRQHPDDGYRRLTYMMLDADVVAVSPATVYRVLSRAGRLGRRWAKSPRKRARASSSPAAPRALARDDQVRVHPARHAALPGGCPAAGDPLGRAL